MKKTLLILSFVIGIVVLDQGVKILAENTLRGSTPHVYLGGLVVLEYAQNPGAFLSLGATLSESARFWIFVVFVTIFVLWAFWYTYTKNLSKIEFYSWILIIGGSIGNLIDRALYGYVIDYVHMGLGGLRTGIFNIADFAIVIGMGILFILSFEKKPKKA